MSDVEAVVDLDRMHPKAQAPVDAVRHWEAKQNGVGVPLTEPCLYTFEVARVYGYMSEWFRLNGSSMIPLDKPMEPRELARLHLAQRQVFVLIDRPMPGGRVETVDPQKMIDPDPAKVYPFEHE